MTKKKETQPEESPKVTSEAATEPKGPGTEQESVLDDLKNKLRRKYHLLKNDPLRITTRDELIKHVASVLGLGLAQAEHDVNDL
jgi:hypothetical protein